MAIFPTYFLRQYRPRKFLLRYSRNKKTPFQGTKIRSSKSRKIDIFPKGLSHGFGPKMSIFPDFFFLSNKGKENVLYDILEPKNAFLRYKNKKFKQSKYSYFLKRVNQWFQSKNGHFSNFFLTQYRTAKCLLRYSKTKKQYSKTKKPMVLVQKQQANIDIFPKGVNPSFWSKNGHFSNFFFQAAHARKMSFTIFQNKKKTPFQPIKTRDSKMAIFPTFFFRQYRQGKCLLRYSTRKKRLSRL